MVVKLVGFTIIFASCTFIGKLMAQGYIKRYQQILMFMTLIEYFETEIAYTSTPVIEILKSLRSNSKEPFKEFIDQVIYSLTGYGYRPLKDVWQEVLYESMDRFSLEKEDIDLIIYFGNILGTTDKENQKKYFTVIKTRLKTQIDEAYVNKNKYKKLFNELGVIVGLLIIILIF